MANITLYGIKNCDTIKKAKKWLESNNIEYTFHDYRVDGIEKQWLIDTEKQLGWEQLLNKRGTTFRQLPDDAKDNVNLGSAIDLMLEQPAMIKRPVLISGDNYHLGFKPDQYAEIFQS
ncbi:ArsC family reductase [Alteromonadaceae bacterium M269]|nr:ArsC family reductase [Alteromonadaceae bacterium M269]